MARDVRQQYVVWPGLVIVMFFWVFQGCGAGIGGSCEELASPGGTCSNVVKNSAFPLSTVDFLDAHGHVLPTGSDDIIATALESAGLTGYIALGLDNGLSLQVKDSKTYANCAWIDPQEEDFEGLMTVLDKGARCIGEISLRHFASAAGNDGDCSDANSDFMKKVYQEARRRKIPINVHYDYSTNHISGFKDTITAAQDSKNGATTFIWAHMGDASASTVRDMLKAHANLMVDISSRNPLCDYDGRFVKIEDQRLDDGTLKIKEEWRTLFEDYADRVMFGTDIGPGSRHLKVKEVVDYYRTILGQLSAGAQAKIASQNARKLFAMP